MRKKYLWTAILVVGLIAVAGMVHARGGLVGSNVPTTGASSAPDNSGGCPLQWLKNMCCGGN
jgi:hypothetical protein